MHKHDFISFIRHYPKLKLQNWPIFAKVLIKKDSINVNQSQPELN